MRQSTELKGKSQAARGRTQNPRKWFWIQHLFRSALLQGSKFHKVRLTLALPQHFLHSVCTECPLYRLPSLFGAYPVQFQHQLSTHCWTSDWSSTAVPAANQGLSLEFCYSLLQLELKYEITSKDSGLDFKSLSSGCCWFSVDSDYSRCQ